jgi:U3 small nucleolar RNA-associated protein 11
MRNAVQRRNHRERAQPQERAKWGLLEKPKDYKLRAADHKVKKRKIKALQQKAVERNEDEFYFAMMNSQGKGGIKVAKRGTENSGGGKVLSGEVVKLMKTQDMGYLRTMLQQTRRERQRVQQEVVSGDVGVKVDVPAPTGKRVVFGDEDENKAAHPTLRNHGSADDSDDWLSDNGSDAEKDEDLSPEEQRKQRTQAVRRRKLDALQDRENDLSIALSEVKTQRARMNGSIGGVNKKGIKFKVRDRKR